jgi:Ni,Fe-hydrogenase III large subunit
LPLGEPDGDYPGIQDLYPAANRMQRATTDLTGIRSTDPDTRPWLRHSAWPADVHPLTSATLPSAVSPPPIDDYAFVRVQGDGVHEVAVGPVHAGTIEPGHFRFSVVGEKVLKLEERLGYVHKGIERRFSELPLLDGHRLAARVSGDSAVAFSWAYCQALEGMAHHRIPARAASLRAIALELERSANHLGDLGAIGNDAGFSFGLAQFSRLKEQLLRTTQQAFGQRYLLDFIVPGGTRLDLDAQNARALGDSLSGCMREVATLRDIYEEHAGLRDRFAGAGIVTSDLAVRLGLIGLAGRASGQEFDLRVDHPWPPYDDMGAAKSTRIEGDVLARVTVRFDELGESVRLVQRMLGMLPAGTHFSPTPIPDPGAFGVGLIEGWRGPVLVALEADWGGRIRRCHPHDPSWQNWPVLEHAIMGNIVPDFPLINKSFNLSYRICSSEPC